MQKQTGRTPPKGSTGASANGRRADRRYERCPECKDLVRAERLSRHRSKVHNGGRGRVLVPLPPIEFEKEEHVLNYVLDQTVDTEDRCMAITRSGARCTRSIAVQLGPRGFCNQHA